MHFDPMLATNQQTGKALSSPCSIHPPKDSPWNAITDI